MTAMRDPNVRVVTELPRLPSWRQRNMSASAVTQTPNPNPNLAAGDWTVVRRRHRHGRRNHHEPQPRPPIPPTNIAPLPWTPSDATTDPILVSRLLSRIHVAISFLSSSAFFRRFVLRLSHHSLLHTSHHLVVYGVGSFASSLPSRLQLALAVLLRREVLPAGPTAVELFDPVLSATEVAAAAALGLTVPPVDEQCRRKVLSPTLFYMPHCEVALYDALLEANWSPAALRQMVVFGNSFERYRTQSEMAFGDAMKIAGNARHVLAARRFAREVEMEEDACLEAEDDALFRAFQNTSWHFFDVDDGDEMQLH